MHRKLASSGLGRRKTKRRRRWTRIKKLRRSRNHHPLHQRWHPLQTESRCRRCRRWSHCRHGVSYARRRRRRCSRFLPSRSFQTSGPTQFATWAFKRWSRRLRPRQLAARCSRVSQSSKRSSDGGRRCRSSSRCTLSARSRTSGWRCCTARPPSNPARLCHPMPPRSCACSSTFQARAPVRCEHTSRSRRRSTSRASTAASTACRRAGCTWAACSSATSSLRSSAGRPTCRRMRRSPPPRPKPWCRPSRPPRDA